MDYLKIHIYIVYGFLIGCDVTLDPLYATVGSEKQFVFNSFTPPDPFTATYEVGVDGQAAIISLSYTNGTLDGGMATYNDTAVAHTSANKVSDGLMVSILSVETAHAGLYKLKDTTDSGADQELQCVMLYVLGESFG